MVLFSFKIQDTSKNNTVIEDLVKLMGQPSLRIGVVISYQYLLPLLLLVKKQIMNDDLRR